MHTNFDPALDPRAVGKDASAVGDDQKAMPFRKYARAWLASDHARLAQEREHKDEPIPEGGLLADVAHRCREALTRGESEGSDDSEPHVALPAKGMQIHEEYTLYGYFFFLDQDSGMRAACLSAFAEEILAGHYDAFYVRVNRDLTLHQKQKRVRAVGGNWRRPNTPTFPKPRSGCYGSWRR